EARPADPTVGVDRSRGDVAGAVGAAITVQADACGLAADALLAFGDRSLVLDDCAALRASANLAFAGRDEAVDDEVALGDGAFRDAHPDDVATVVVVLVLEAAAIVGAAGGVDA